MAVHAAQSYIDDEPAEQEDAMNAGAWIAIQVATQLAAQQSRVVQQLERVEARDASHAVPLHADECDVSALQSLLDSGRVVEARPGYYYLGNVPAKSETRRVLVLASVLLLVVLGVLMAVFILLRIGGGGGGPT